ncbi:hypothetical protein L198_02639 [Cryptococcus wingfieldii CBS 7118]|uniref:Uncharacterized protein n=1 Tax=Cryptococcus wingfieldii CBS 7118 TaxID=1295528 RepID=A0A1E3JM29_9TREE|nr:hypothetical protein L198_02639 [Cryptococcus wingfieldii CBS 7118]ODO01910.1 hypothetical protein L198_02639 [Cryptococcus wingfieldii CBS 7118]
MYRRPNLKEARLKEALESVWPDYAITGRKPEPFPLPTFPIISLDALYPVHPEILDILFFSSPKTYMLLSKKHYARVIPLFWRLVVLTEALINAIKRKDSRVLNHLQHMVSVRIGSLESINALESMSSRLSNGDVFRKVTQVEFTATTFKRCWTSGPLLQIDVGSIEDCLGDNLEELIIRISRVPSKKFTLYQAAFTQLLGSLPPLVTMILSLPNPHAPSWVDFLERFPELLRHWTLPQCLRIVFKIPEQMTSLVKVGVENAIVKHIRTRAIDTAREPTGGAGGKRVEYHFSGAEEMESRISAKFAGNSILNQQILKDFEQKKYRLVELPLHAFSYKKDGTDMAERE